MAAESWGVRQRSQQLSSLGVVGVLLGLEEGDGDIRKTQLVMRKMVALDTLMMIRAPVMRRLMVAELLVAMERHTLLLECWRWV